jgi:signal transduction histidine kinase
MTLALAAWTVAIGIVLSLSIYREKQQALEFAEVQARSALNKDLAYRRWNASYGGVYVPVTEKSQPNPYLKVPNRDVTTTTGIELTLINPAYMTRQVHEMSQAQYGERGHITSLNPIRPQNAPDAWETEALKSFETGSGEVSSVETINQVKYLRLMIPLIAEENCLKCHAEYKAGDIRGGLSVSVPLSPYLASYASDVRNAAFGYGLLWILGVAGILVAGRRIGRQVDEQALAEGEIRQLNASLEQRVEERTQELRVAQEDLVRKEKLSVLGQIADSVGHELRNPMGVISNAVYFLKMAQPDANEKIKEYLDLIEKHIYLSNMIVTDLLDFTRVESVERKSISVAKIIHQTLERFPAPESVQVEIDLPADLPNIYADSQHIIQILGNLALNAYQAMAPKGGKLAVSARIQDNMICIALRDSGVGISPENMEKLFEPLFTTKPKGIGLGLAVSKKLIEANDGRIEVESEVGVGSTFKVWLPMQ